ncbi:MAG TPA: hypothetical protein VMG58_09170 [Candidatus Sulfotelmatobacter sp.]|nr:hypothetical protein [Candidatus Sulfotelmatobacter sp.]
MEEYFVLGLVGFTSLASILVGTRWGGLSLEGFREAIRQTLETIGIAIAFFAFNLVLGSALILVGRTVFRHFISLYLADDIGLLILSLLQGLLVQHWRLTRYCAIEWRQESEE